MTRAVSRPPSTRSERLRACSPWSLTPSRPSIPLLPELLRQPRPAHHRRLPIAVSAGSCDLQGGREPLREASRRAMGGFASGPFSWEPLNPRKLHGRDDVIESTMRFCVPGRDLRRAPPVPAQRGRRAPMQLGRQRLGASKVREVTMNPRPRSGREVLRSARHARPPQVLCEPARHGRTHRNPQHSRGAVFPRPGHRHRHPRRLCRRLLPHRHSAGRGYFCWAAPRIPPGRESCWFRPSPDWSSPSLRSLLSQVARQRHQPDQGRALYLRRLHRALDRGREVPALGIGHWQWSVARPGGSRVADRSRAGFRPRPLAQAQPGASAPDGSRWRRRRSGSRLQCPHYRRTLRHRRGHWTLERRNPGRYRALAISSVVVERWFLGDAPLFHVPVYHLSNAAELLAYVALGLAGGLASIVFVKLIKNLRPYLRRQPQWTQYLQPALAGSIIGFIAIRFPQPMGAGYEWIDMAMHNRFAWKMLAIFAILKLITTVLSFASGTPGGLYAPVLFIGAMMGARSAPMSSTCFHISPYPLGLTRWWAWEPSSLASCGHR